ncbi:flippase activity-associated protein Agl23 [Salinirubrum litoreum]|uniref:Flippase activity-associated protein Agl23 n=1 Tax=Salinirubrum litoreum TaxID=1126234 RepID=A0ABD5R8N5_9EURY|nr:flippase activity-associated protein Agl23 [Salinirubrum litoreum]
MTADASSADPADPPSARDDTPSPDYDDSPGGTGESLLGRLAGDRSNVLLAVLFTTVAALVLRLYALGGRIFHWDEARVGYWLLRYHESGQLSYRPIIHGPFVPVVNDYLFTAAAAFGMVPSDFLARLPVAVIGGLLPLAAWLFRDHLRDAEIVALAGLLALNPILVYYSRFMRSDLLVATFAVFALGFLVRAITVRDARYLTPAGVSLGLAFTTKENALIYVVCFAGAAALLLDHRLVTRREDLLDRLAEFRRASRSRALADGGQSPSAGSGDTGATAPRSPTRPALVAGGLREVARRFRGWWGHAVGALVGFFLVIVFFYAPRPDLWQAFGNPAMLPGVVGEATVGSWEKFVGTWASGGHQDHAYLPFLYGFLETLLHGAFVVIPFAVLGFLADRYSGDGPRDLVAFASYWGFVSILGYPIATDIEAPWATVHAIVPLAVPAAVGLAMIYRSGRASLSADDAVSTGLAALVILVAVGGAVGANVTYMNSTNDEHREVLQWAQPHNDMKDTLLEVRDVVRENEGTDVLFYGGYDGDEPLFYVRNESDALQPPGPGGGEQNWLSRMPLPWYLEKWDANVTSTPPSEAGAPLQDPPPVVIVHEQNLEQVEGQLETYEGHRHYFRLWYEKIVIFVDEDRIETGA